MEKDIQKYFTDRPKLQKIGVEMSSIMNREGMSTIEVLILYDHFRLEAMVKLLEEIKAPHNRANLQTAYDKTNEQIFTEAVRIADNPEGDKGAFT